MIFPMLLLTILRTIKFNTMAKAEQPDLTPSSRQEGNPHRPRALDNGPYNNDFASFGLMS
jgi:hypothetical protein